MLYDIISERATKYDFQLTSPMALYDFIKAKYGAKRQEQFIIVSLNGARMVNAVRIVSVGIMNRTIIHPREVFYQAIKDNSESIILVHNHPSGKLDPSREDIEITKRLIEAGKIIGIPVIDHVVIGKDSFHSMAENEGYLFQA